MTDYKNPWTYHGEVFTSVDIGKNVGFVYLITDLSNGKKYVGKKNFTSRRRLKPLKGKTRKRVKVSESNWMEYYGSGVDIEDHPLKDRCNMHGCAECKSDNVKVIYGKWCVSTHSGDSYFDYEVVCEDCGKFTARSFNEND